MTVSSAPDGGKRDDPDRRARAARAETDGRPKQKRQREKEQSRIAFRAKLVKSSGANQNETKEKETTFELTLPICVPHCRQAAGGPRHDERCDNEDGQRRSN